MLGHERRITSTYSLLRRIMGGTDDLALVAATIAEEPLCTACLAEKTSLPPESVSVALKALIRTKEATPSLACDSCQNTVPSFRGTASS